MALAALLTPARRDAVLAVLALALLVAPVWAPMVHLGDPTYRYGSARVTAADGTVEYANDATRTLGFEPISSDIACTAESLLSRGCFFEHHLAAGHTVSTSISSGMAGRVEFPTYERYDYAVVNGTVYETSYVADRSRQNDDGRHRIELALDPASAAEALREASVPVEDVPAPVREAAETGVGTAHRDVEVPKTPVRRDDGRYYRVYHAGTTDPSDLESLAAGLLRWGSPLAGLGLLGRLSGRVEVSYVGDGRSG